MPLDVLLHQFLGAGVPLPEGKFRGESLVGKMTPPLLQGGSGPGLIWNIGAALLVAYRHAQPPSLQSWCPTWCCDSELHS
jgi:hypothetical protein